MSQISDFKTFYSLYSVCSFAPTAIIQVGNTQLRIFSLFYLDPEDEIILDSENIIYLGSHQCNSYAGAEKLAEAGMENISNLLGV